MILTVGELAHALDEYGDDRPVRVSMDPQGGPEAAHELTVEAERWPDEATGKLREVVVIYPV